MSNATRMALACTAVLFCGVAVDAQAVVPGFRNDTCPVKLNGVRLGSDLTPLGASLRNTIVYEPLTNLYHLWGFAADDQNFPSAASSLRAVVHATSTDGLHFTSDSNLSYAFGSASYTTFGATIDPPLDFLRAAYDTSSGTWKLFAWTENDQVSSPSFGQYNYNTSVNDLGTVASTTAVLHQGPLTGTYLGNEVGPFGLVDGSLFLREDADGNNAQLAYTDGMPPAAGSVLSVPDLYAGTPYCWGLVSSCGTSDPRIPAYVHNAGRTLLQSDGTLTTYYSFRNWDGSRVEKQLWYVASSDNGKTWSAPATVFADGNAITIDGQPTAADGFFSSVESVQMPNICRMYFSTIDANGNYVMVSATTGSGCDALFADGFDGCGN